MSTALTMHERHTAILARLAEVGEQLAMKHAQRALEADDPEIEARATIAYHRAARSVRQCLALEAKLVRDAARAEREDRDDAQRKASSRRDRRRFHARTVVAHLIWTESENETEAERLESDLDDLLGLEAFAEDLDEETAEALIARLCRDLGLSLPAGAAAGRSSRRLTGLRPRNCDPGPALDGSVPPPRTPSWELRRSRTRRRNDYFAADVAARDSTSVDTPEVGSPPRAEGRASP